MIIEFKGKTVLGIFIAEKLDRSVQLNLITRAMNSGHKIVPMEAEDFLRIMSLLEVSKRDFWKANLDHIWNIYSRESVGRAGSPG